MYIKLYADIMIVVNIIVLYFAICITDIINKCNTRFVKKILVSIIMSLIYTIVSIYNINFAIDNNYLFVLLLSVLYSIPCRLYDMVRNFVIITIVGCVLFGGINYMMRYVGYINIFSVAVVSFAVYLIIKIGIYYVNYKKYYTLDIYVDNKRVRLNALLDSGNLLRDYITGKPVVIAQRDKLEKILDNVSLRPLSYKSLGNDYGVFYIFCADKASVNNNVITKPIIAIYDTKLSDDGKYNAIIGLKHLGGK